MVVVSADVDVNDDTDGGGTDDENDVVGVIVDVATVSVEDTVPVSTVEERTVLGVMGVDEDTLASVEDAIVIMVVVAAVLVVCVEDAIGAGVTGMHPSQTPGVPKSLTPGLKFFDEVALIHDVARDPSARGTLRIIVCLMGRLAPASGVLPDPATSTAVPLESRSSILSVVFESDTVVVTTSVTTDAASALFASLDA